MPLDRRGATTGYITTQELLAVCTVPPCVNQVRASVPSRTLRHHVEDPFSPSRLQVL